jgi:hypothetical protein
MVIFYLGKLPSNRLVEFPVQLFDSTYEPAWLNSDIGKRIVKGIDKSDIVGDRVISSPALGMIPPDYLSCGCKSVLLAAFSSALDDKMLDGSKMGDNCFPWLFVVARELKKPVRVQVGRLLRQPWGEEEDVMFWPKKECVKGYKAAFHYLAMHTDMFYKGDGYGKDA